LERQDEKGRIVVQALFSGVLEKIDPNIWWLAAGAAVGLRPDIGAVCQI
jgi:hypothetical protein